MRRTTFLRSSDGERVLRGLSLVVQEFLHINVCGLVTVVPLWLSRAVFVVFVWWRRWVHSSSMISRVAQKAAVARSVVAPIGSTVHYVDPTVSTAEPHVAAKAQLSPIATVDPYFEPKPSSLSEWKPVERSKREYKEVNVPSGSVSRAWQFGTLAAKMAAGGVAEAVSRGLGVKDASGSLFLTETNADRLASALCRMRGAALKIGQMLSLADDTVLPPVVTAALERVRAQADVMPRAQLESVMASQLGDGWRTMFAEFDDKPMAAASIGQVHKAKLHDGREVAVKVQYPGVAESIDSDLKNLQRLLTMMDVFPKGLYIEDAMEVARKELHLECDYIHEANNQEKYRLLMGKSAHFHVPEVIRSHSNKTVLTTTFAKGVAIDHVADMPQDTRNYVARLLLRLTLQELFEFRFMQTDPNWGNFLFDPETGKISVIDFGAANEYSEEFVRNYAKLIWAATRQDIDSMMDVSLKMGFLTGDESAAMKQAHLKAGLTVGEPFTAHEPFDFHGSGIVTRVASHAKVFSTDRLCPPPTEVYSLHRRLSGCFLTCIRLRARMKCRDLLELHAKHLDADNHVKAA